jgi:hypothetical protein
VVDGWAGTYIVGLAWGDVHHSRGVAVHEDVGAASPAIVIVDADGVLVPMSEGVPVVGEPTG